MLVVVMDDRIVPVTANRVPDVAAMFARAFLDDPLLRWPLGEVTDPLEAIEAEFMGTHTLVANCGGLWEVGDAVGAAAWISPSFAEAYWQELNGWTDGIVSHAPDGGRRHLMQWAWIETHYPDEQMWFLDSIAVDPAQQGSGVGSSLIRHGLRSVDESRLPAFLETARPHLVGYYERFGFTVVDEGDVPEGGPHVWFMRRPATT
jgi:GNAT superfamily N-acetyltransferase